MDNAEKVGFIKLMKNFAQCTLCNGLDKAHCRENLAALGFRGNISGTQKEDSV